MSQCQDAQAVRGHRFLCVNQLGTSPIVSTAFTELVDQRAREILAT
jgi:hypothetical protein